MNESALFALQDVVLELRSEIRVRAPLASLLEELCWTRTRTSQGARSPRLHIAVCEPDRQLEVPSEGREVIRTDEFLGFEHGDDFFLTDRSTVFHLRLGAREAHARVAEAFFAKPARVQANFWCFGLLKLLRPLGFYSLHCAGLTTPDGQGLLVVGPSGSGKSTLAISLIKAGWRYLSDDAVLLRERAQRVEAIACRKSFYIDARSSSRYSEFSLEPEEPDANCGTRRRIAIEEAYSGGYTTRCVPRTIVFPTISAKPHSKLTPIGRLKALQLLLTQSAPQLFDRPTMPAHLELLQNLLNQADAFELEAGADLYDQPANLAHLIDDARGAINCRVSSLN